MSDAFDSATTNLMSTALNHAIERLKTLGLVDGLDGTVATAQLSRIILEAVQGGERDQENLVLLAVGRFQPPASPARPPK